MNPQDIQRLVKLDHAHVWHPFTPMRQWRQDEPIVIEAGEGEFLIDANGRRYIDGVSSLWCNLHGHRVPEVDQAIRDQLDRIGHSTLLGLTHGPAAELAAKLSEIAPGDQLRKVFYSDSGATATEVAFKMAVGYWHHRGQPDRHTFIALGGAYHGDTVGAMSIGYSELFHRPFRRMVFHTEFVEPPTIRSDHRWPLEDSAACDKARDEALATLEAMLQAKGDQIAGIVIEPLVQGAAGMLVQPPGYLRGVADLARRYGTLLIADEVATGFGRTGAMFACDIEHVTPDLLCLGKGLTAGYLPLAATLATDEIAEAFEGELHEHRTLYHGHTFTGNPLGCVAALASIDLIERNNLLEQVNTKAKILAEALNPLRDSEWVADVRQQGLMLGLELTEPGKQAGGSWLTGPGSSGGSVLGDFGETDSPQPVRRIGYDVCMACRDKGLIVRPLGNTVVLMPPPAISEANLRKLAATVVETIGELK